MISLERNKPMELKEAKEKIRNCKEIIIVHQNQKESNKENTIIRLKSN